MEHRVNQAALSTLIQQAKDDPELLDYIFTALKSFEEYHNAVMADQFFPIVYSGGGMDGEQYRTKRAELDKRRTTAHNALLANVNLLNRMAAAVGIEPVYDGTVSEERPYRRMVADAVFDYLSVVINNRS